MIPENSENTLKDRIENNERQTHPRMMALVGTWKFNPPSMDYKGPGLARIATDSQGKEYIKLTSEQAKKDAIYDAFASTEAFKKELQNIIDKTDNTVLKWLDNAEKRTLITTGALTKKDGTTITMPGNKFSFFGYEACNNPSIGIELGEKFIITKKGDTTYASAIMQTVENSLGTSQSETTNFGIGFAGESILSKAAPAGSVNNTVAGGTASDVVTDVGNAA